MTSIKELLESIIEASKPKTQAFDTTATVTRVENGIAWVHIPGGVRETPVNLTINAQAGDTVQVRVSGGRAFLVGNASAPPTDDHVATQAVQSIEKTDKVVAVVKEMAERVTRIAGNTNQFFWHTETGTDTGAHITEIPQEEFLADPDHGGGNLLARSNGVAVRDGLTELAIFGTETAIYTKNGTELAHFGYARGNAETGTAVQPYYSIGKRATATEDYSASNTYAKGDVVLYGGAPYVCCEDIITAEAWNADHWLKANVGNWSVAEGSLAVASGAASHAEGQKTMAAGTDAHAEGYKTVASGGSAHAEGGTTVASGSGSHAEGQDTVASGGLSHAEGYSTVASGITSHAEGYSTVASGYASHAGGFHTKATRQYQTVIGYYNELTETDGVVDAGKYIFVVGNGSGESNRSNAFAIGWGGATYGKGNATFLSKKMVYEAGDVMTATGLYAGHLTGSSKQVQFFVPLPKPVASGVSVTLSGNWAVRHVGGGYILSGNTLQSIGTVSATVYETGIYVSVELTNAVSVTNNTPVTVNGTSSAKITFS